MTERKIISIKNSTPSKVPSDTQVSVCVCVCVRVQCWEGYFGNVIGYRLQVTLFKI